MAGNCLGKWFLQTTQDKRLFSFFYDLFVYLLCVQCYACMYSWRTEEGTIFYYRWLRATMWFPEIDLRTLEEQPVLLTSEPSLQAKNPALPALPALPP